MQSPTSMGQLSGMRSGELHKLSDLCRLHAAEYPDRAAAVLGENQLSYSDLEKMVERMARAMVSQGLRHGDRVAILSTPRPEYLIFLLSTIRIGGIVVGLNPVHQFDEHQKIIGGCRPKFLFAFERARDRDNRETLARLAAENRNIERLVTLDDDRAPNGLAGFLASADDADEELYKQLVAGVTLDDVAQIVYTSGSTGSPKGAMITHRNLAHCAAVQHMLFPISPLRILCNVPVTHTLCSCDIIAYALTAAGTIVFQERFDVEAVLGALRLQGINCLIQVPAMLQKILVSYRQAPFRTDIQLLLFLGSRMPRELIDELLTLGRKVVTGWGLTEATSSVTYTDLADDTSVLAETAGRVAPTFELRIVHQTGGTTLDIDEPGEVQVRGPCVMAGYFEDPLASAAAMAPDGWLRTGDLGLIDSKGRLRIVGRIKEMFKSGGYNVYPKEIELVLESHPQIALAAVVSVPDPLFDEVGFAFVIGNDRSEINQGELERYCRSRLGNYKVPKGFSICATLPMLEIGKVDKSALCKIARELLDSSGARSERP